jgi:hypothetical protein
MCIKFVIYQYYKKMHRPKNKKKIKNWVNFVWLAEYLLFWFISILLINCVNVSVRASLLEQGTEVEKAQNFTNLYHSRQQYLCHRL